MKFEAHQAVDRDQYVYTLTIDGGDLMRARLDAFDRALIADCASSDATIADQLLGLETVVRRIEQAGVAA